MNTSPQGECSNPYQGVNVNANVNALTFAGSQGRCMNTSPQGECSNPFQGVNVNANVNAILA